MKKEPKIKKNPGAKKKPDLKKMPSKLISGLKKLPSKLGSSFKKKPSKEKEGVKVFASKKRSILTTLLASFMVPVLLMITLGIVSYQTASSGIISKYKESAVSTVSAVGEYAELICESIRTKALEMATNSDVGEYYNKYYKKNNSEAMEVFRNANNIIINTQSTNPYVFSISVIPEAGAYLSILTGSMTDNPSEDFFKTAEGNYFVENATAQNAWMGYHSYLDEYLSSEAGDYSMTFYQKMRKTKSYIVMDVSMDVTKDMLAQMDFGEGSVKALISGDGREVSYVQMSDDEVAKDIQISEETWFVGTEFFEATKDAEEIGNQDVVINGKKYVYIYTPVGTTGAMICALIPQSNLLGQVGNIKYITVVMVILAAGAALAIGFVISTGISKTVNDISQGLSVVAQGDFSKDFKTKRKDEFKALTGSLNDMIKSMRVLMQEMKEFGAQVNNLSSEVSEKTTAINDSMQDISTAMDEVAEGVQSQAEDTESSNENMITFSRNISAVTDETERMGQTADKAIDVVAQGKVIVQDLSEKSDTTVSLTRVLVKDIDEVQKSSAEIKSFVDVISNIAEQTNLLSLNASIEAARVGEAGRGFAVVAEEIRKLADQSKESGNKIRDIVENINNTTNKTTVSARKAENMVNEQAKALEQTVDVFGMIHECVGELVEGIRLVTEKLEESMKEKDNVENSLQNISAVSEEVAASTQEVTATLNEQVSVIQNLKDEVEELRAGALTLSKSIEKFKID